MTKNAWPYLGYTIGTYYQGKCWRHDGFDPIHYFNACRVLYNEEVNAMNNQLYQVYRHPAPTKNAKWCVQFLHGIFSYRTKAIALKVAAAAKLADEKIFERTMRHSTEYYNLSDRDAFKSA